MEKTPKTANKKPVRGNLFDKLVKKKAEKAAADRAVSEATKMQKEAQGPQVSPI